MVTLLLSACCHPCSLPHLGVQADDTGSGSKPHSGGDQGGSDDGVSVPGGEGSRGSGGNSSAADGNGSAPGDDGSAQEGDGSSSGTGGGESDDDEIDNTPILARLHATLNPQGISDGATALVSWGVDKLSRTSVGHEAALCSILWAAMARVGRPLEHLLTCRHMALIAKKAVVLIAPFVDLMRENELGEAQWRVERALEADKRSTPTFVELFDEFVWLISQVSPERVHISGVGGTFAAL